MHTYTRLFVAIELPESTKNILAKLQHALPGMTWAQVLNIHLTLRFIGQVGPEQKVHILEGLEQVRVEPFFLSLSGLGIFLKKSHAVLWVGVARSPALLGLKKEVDNSLERFAGLAVEQGRFTPHITLGRMKKPNKKVLKEFIAQYSDTMHGIFSVDCMTLLQSILTADGAVHVVAARYYFNGLGL
ncbi:MAG: RNA 2',3'-cyclic phosphodiesterase [Desulfomicrobium sp.]|nr:RNA 2',3'-cyclic phosphodiesterase [Desulfomicrobium sp.]